MIDPNKEVLYFVFEVSSQVAVPVEDYEVQDLTQENTETNDNENG